MNLHHGASLEPLCSATGAQGRPFTPRCKCVLGLLWELSPPQTPHCPQGSAPEAQESTRAPSDSFLAYILYSK